MTTLSCKVISIESITDAVYRIRLFSEEKFFFRAGQYLIVIMSNGDRFPFSMASLPSEKKLIEIHIGVSDFNLYTMTVMKRIFEQHSVNVDIPHGKAWFREGSKKPIILIAGGTGFSYAGAIFQAALEENPDREITFYWGGRRLEHLYNLGELQYFSKQYSNIKIIPVVEQLEEDWNGRTGTVLSAVLEDFGNLANHEIYIAGRFEMAKIARERFCNEKQGIAEYLYGDAFEFI